MGQQDLTIQELVAKIERSEIRLPEMQRNYVWNKTRVRDLLDSLYRGYPSGTILTWGTDTQVATQDFAVPVSSSGNNFQLLLDGQQRLTSLSAIVRGKPVFVRGRRRPIDILFNLEHPDNLEIITEVNESDGDSENDTLDEDTTEATENELLKSFGRLAFIVSSKKLEALPNWVSVTKVFQESSDIPFLKKAGVTTMEDKRYDKYSSRLKKLRGIKDCQYRVHILERTLPYEEVTEIFVRVNSRGVKLRGSDLALAQITAKWPNSLRVFEEFRNSCREQGFDLDLGIHLKNLVSFVTRQSRFHLVSGLSREQLEKGWENAKEGMDFALNFLRSNTDIDSPALLSSPFIIIVIAYYGYAKEYNLLPEEAQLLRHWVLITNAKARYSRGSTETYLDQDLATIRRSGNISDLIQLLRTQVGRIEVQADDLENRNSRSAYFKTMLLAFRAQQATDWRDQLAISLKHQGSKHSLQFHHIFPQKVLKREGISKDKINDICNLSFISGRTNRAISANEPASYLPDIVLEQGIDVLTRQCIPTEESLWRVDAYDRFFHQRRKLVAARLNEFLGHGDTRVEKAT